jgi:RNA polymerase sigma-70 factor (ECF subfamily)
MLDNVANGKAGVYDRYEAELVERAKARSPEAWTQIYTRNYAAVYRYVNARVFEKETTEDLASTVFLESIKGIDSYKYQGQPIMAWLYRIARNVVSNHQRQLLGRRGDAPRQFIRSIFGKSETRGGRAVEDVIDAPSSAEEPALLVQRMDLRDALAKLTESQREIVILRFFVGLKTPEIAAVIGKEPAAVYSQEARALTALRKHLE